MLTWFEENYLQANPNKFQLTFDRQHAEKEDQMEIIVGNTVVKAQSTVKLLGIHIDNKLSFNNHVLYICKRAGFKLNALARLSTKLDFNGKPMLFNAFILSHFMYSPVVWHLCGATCLKMIEKIQKRALRYVTNDYVS